MRSTKIRRGRRAPRALVTPLVRWISKGSAAAVQAHTHKHCLGLETLYISDPPAEVRRPCTYHVISQLHPNTWRVLTLCSILSSVAIHWNIGIGVSCQWTLKNSSPLPSMCFLLIVNLLFSAAVIFPQSKCIILFHILSSYNPPSSSPFFSASRCLCTILLLHLYNLLLHFDIPNDYLIFRSLLSVAFHTRI